MPIGQHGLRVGEDADERPGFRRGFRVKDANMDGIHSRSLSREGDPLARMVRAYVGLGANVGDPAGTLAAAVRALDAAPDLMVRAVSRLYATRPVGVTDQPDFLNAVVALDAPAGADPAEGAIALLARLKTLERSFGRRLRGRWGPRELDLDLLIFGRSTIRVERPPEALSLGAGPGPAPVAAYLEVPHRDARERLFVLAPLADVARWLAPPGWRETVETARRRRATMEGDDAVRPIAPWDPERGRWRAVGDGPQIA